ncbi:MAG: AAA family ATPase [Candidatus Micrarchaeia archaeon]
MKKAILLFGPSGVGKSTVAAMICKNHGFKHCDADEFKWRYSHKRSKKRTEIGEAEAFAYAKQLIHAKENLVVEALPDKYLKKLAGLLKRGGYKVLEISLCASVKQCVRNNASRKRKNYDAKVIRAVYRDLSRNRGLVVNTEGLSAWQTYNLIKKALDKRPSFPQK